MSVVGRLFSSLGRFWYFSGRQNHPQEPPFGDLFGVLKKGSEKRGHEEPRVIPGRFEEPGGRTYWSLKNRYQTPISRFQHPNGFLGAGCR